MAYGAGDNPHAPKTKTVNVKAHTRTIKVKEPAGDVASSGGNYGLPEAKKAANSPQVKRNTAAVYASQPVAQRQRIIRNARGPVAAAVRPVHAQRQARARELARFRARHDVITPGDLNRAKRYLAAHPEILNPPQPKHGSGLFGTVLGTADTALSGKLTAGAVHAAEGVVSHVLPLEAKIMQGPVGLGGNYLLKKATGLDITGTVDRLARNAGRELVDIPANTIPSIYVPAREAAGGNVKGAAKMLADPIIQTFKHPVRSFEQHPVGTGLILAGGVRGLDRGLGKVERATTGRNPARDSATVPGTNLVQARRTAKGFVSRRTQQARDTRRGPQVMSDHEIRRRVDESVAASEDIRRLHRSQVMHEAQQAIGKKPTAAVTLATQGITHATKEDLLVYRRELDRAAQGLTGAKLHANKQQRAHIDQAIKGFDGPKTTEAARNYAALSTRLQGELVKRGLYDATQAERRRLLPYAIRHMGAKHDGNEFVGPHGEKLTNDAIRAHMRAHGALEDPAFVTHAPNQRGARNFFVATHEPPKASSVATTGKAVTEGTADVHPDVLVEQAARAQGLVDAADRYGRFVHEFAARGGSGKIRQLPTYKRAQQAAENLKFDAHGNPTGAVEMRPVRLAPFASKKGQLDALVDTANSEEHPAYGVLHKQVDDALAGEEASTDGGPWTLVPKVAADQMRSHVSTLGAKDFGSAALGRLANVYGGTFRKVVLATSPKWLAGNVIEAALRSLVAHAGPRSYYTGRRSLRTLDTMDPAAGAEARARTSAGGHYSLASRANVHTRADHFAGTRLAGLARGVGAFWRAPGPKQLAEAWHAYTDFVFNSFNGRIESQFQTAMLGKALRESPLMSDRVMKLSKTAIDEAAKGLKDTNAQVALGREVDRMYGRYGKFGPGMKRLVAGYTPFIAWTLNATRFILDVLPRDHPVATALLVSANQATEQWRKDHGLVTWMQGAAPMWLQGSVPEKGNAKLRLSRFTPFGAFDNEGALAGTYASSVLPQFQGLLNNLQGKDWKGDKLKGQSIPLAAAVSIIEASIPAAGQAMRIHANPGNLKQKVNKELNPFYPTLPNGPAAGGTAAGPPDPNLGRLIRRAQRQAAHQPSASEIARMIRRAQRAATP